MNLIASCTPRVTRRTAVLIGVVSRQTPRLLQLS